MVALNQDQTSPSEPHRKQAGVRSMHFADEAIRFLAAARRVSKALAEQSCHLNLTLEHHIRIKMRA
jgi:hypothetical protein